MRSGLFSRNVSTSQGDIVTTPDTILIYWQNVKPNYSMIKVIWEDGVESEPVRIADGSADLSVHFKKGAKPTRTRN